MQLTPLFKRLNRKSINSLLVLLVLTIVFSALTSLADNRGIIISQDAQLNINVSVDPSLVSDAKIHRYNDKMIIELPHKAFPTGFKTGTLRVDSASRALVKIGRTDTATTVTIRSTKIFMSIQDLSSLATVSKNKTKTPTRVTSKPVIQSAQAKIDAIKATNIEHKEPTNIIKKASKWLEIPVHRNKTSSTAVPKTKLSSQKTKTVSAPSTPQAPKLDPSVIKRPVSQSQTLRPQPTSSPSKKPTIPSLETDTALQEATAEVEKPETKPAPEKEEPKEANEEKKEDEKNKQDALDDEVATDLETEDIQEEEILEELTLLALEEDIDLNQFQNSALSEGQNGLPLENIMKPADSNIFSDGTLIRIVLSFLFVLLLIAAFFKYALPKLLIKYPDFFKNRQAKYEESLAATSNNSAQAKKQENPINALRKKVGLGTELGMAKMGMGLVKKENKIETDEIAEAPISESKILLAPTNSSKEKEEKNKLEESFNEDKSKKNEESSNTVDSLFPSPYPEDHQAEETEFNESKAEQVTINESPATDSLKTETEIKPESRPIITPIHLARKAKRPQKKKPLLPSLSVKKLDLSRIKVWNPLPSLIGMTDKISQDFKDHKEQQKMKRYNNYMKQLAQLNPEFNSIATREIKPNYALHLVELWGRHLITATTPKNVSILGALSESGANLYFEDMSPDNGDLLNSLLGDKHTINSLFKDVPFKSLPKSINPKTSKAEKDSAESIYEKYLPKNEEELQKKIKKESQKQEPLLPRATPRRENLEKRRHREKAEDKQAPIKRMIPESQAQRRKAQEKMPPLVGQPMNNNPQPTVIPDPTQWSQPVFKKLAESSVMTPPETPVSAPKQKSNEANKTELELPKTQIPVQPPVNNAPSQASATLTPNTINPALQLPEEDLKRAKQKQAEIRNEVEQFVSKALTPKQSKHPYQNEEVTILNDYDDEF